MRTRKIINEWDPIKLLSFSPSNEYDLEIKEIEELIKKNNDIDFIAKGILDIFIKYFGRDIFKPNLEECKVIAQKLKCE